MRVATEIGYAEYSTIATDLFLVGATIAIGGLIGVMAFNVGGVTLKLSSPVGALLGRIDARPSSIARIRALDGFRRHRPSCSSRWGSRHFSRSSRCRPVPKRLPRSAPLA
jgi:hypothetical protein